MADWTEEELAGSIFPDKRLGNRFRLLVRQLSDRLGETIPMACEDWANVKAAYRFLANDRVHEDDILAGHFQSTRKRFDATPGTVLVLHDTTQFSFKREDLEPIGKIGRAIGQKDSLGRLHQKTVGGILMHSSLVISSEGLPLGLAAIKFWTRKEFKGARALKNKINSTRVPIEEKESFRWVENLRQVDSLLEDPARCVHIGDRESDIFELFYAAHQAETHFVFRIFLDRLAGDGQHTISKEMSQTKIQHRHVIQIRNAKGQLEDAVLAIRYQPIRIHPPQGKQKRFPELSLTVIDAEELDPPPGRDPIHWKLMTNLPILSPSDAIEKLNWYALRWKIETFHKILKSGCKAEESKLRTAERLVNWIALLCILSWRIFWMTMMNRSTSQVPVSVVFTDLECLLLERLRPEKKSDSPNKKSLSSYIIKLARLGGYLARANDSPPGNTVIWRGMLRLMEIQLGFELAQDVGNRKS
jgi:Transposase DNA-binding/Transposase DDE domain